MYLCKWVRDVCMCEISVYVSTFVSVVCAFLERRACEQIVLCVCVQVRRRVGALAICMSVCVGWSVAHNT